MEAKAKGTTHAVATSDSVGLEEEEHVEDDVDNNNNYNTSSDGGEIDVEVKGKGTTHAGTTSDSVGLEEDLENEMREQQKNIEKNIKVFTNYHLLWCCGTSQNDHFFGC